MFRTSLFFKNQLILFSENILHRIVSKMFLNKKLYMLISLAMFSGFLLIYTNRNIFDQVNVTKFDDEKITFKLDLCNCDRTLPAPIETNHKIEFNQTTCSMDSFRRGSSQNVITYSFYGDADSDDNKAKGFFEGIRDNLEQMKIFWPGWTMRLYIDLDAGDPILKSLCDLACADSSLDLCNAATLPGNPMNDVREMFPMNWRFLPTLDPQVDVILSRDLDSRFSDREVAAVTEWMNSEKPLHVMRDHPDHDAPILGGCWGADLTKKNSRELWSNSWSRIINDPQNYAPRNVKGEDQEILTRHIWRDWGRSLSFQHDSFLCRKYPGSIGFPTQRMPGPNNFVGAVVKENLSMKEPCPMRCRRKKEWEYC